jgi:MSHA pilin protein MshC
MEPMRQSDHRLQGGALLSLQQFSVRQGGFTLIELVVTIVLLGILSVSALPRLFVSSDFDAFGFHGETLSYLRYAQKTAIAQRRTVCVAFTLSSVTLSISSNPATYNCSSVGALIGPKGESSPVTLNARPGISFSALPTAFYFDGLGQPISVAGTGAAQSTQTFQVSGVSKSITVETATGYVHE